MPTTSVGDLAVDVTDGGAHALAAVALAAVTELDRLVGARARPARDDGPPARARQQLDLDLDGGVAPRVEDLAARRPRRSCSRRRSLAARKVSDGAREPSVVWLV